MGFSGEDWSRRDGEMGSERYAVRPSLEEIFEGKEADEGIYEAFTRNESIKHNFHFST